MHTPGQIQMLWTLDLNGFTIFTHGHMDGGSFVMEAACVRRCLDFGMQDYTSLEMKNIDSWPISRMVSAGKYCGTITWPTIPLL
jgi:galactose-1-phosphate uridylyltransferase